jgi:hypothetical protein
MWDVIRWIAFSLLALFFVVMFVANWAIRINNIRGKKSVSYIPFLGGLSGAGALLVMPLEGAWHYCRVPLVVEWGTVPGLVHVLIYHLFLKNKKK